MSAAVEENGSERLRVLREHSALDRSAEQAFDDLTQLAAQVCRTPAAWLTLLDENRPWIKSQFGPLDGTLCLDASFCAEVIRHPHALVVSDASADPRFAKRPWVTDGPRIRFYAGAPLVNREGRAVGILAVFDCKPRELGSAEKEGLLALSRQAMDQLEWSRRRMEETIRGKADLTGNSCATLQEAAKIRASEEKYRRLFETSKDGIAFVSLDGKIENANEAYCQMLGYTLAEITELTYQQITPAKWAAMEQEIVEKKILRLGHAEQYEKEYIRKDGTIFPVSIRVWLLPGERGEPARFLGIVTDITERKRSEKRLGAFTELGKKLSAARRVEGAAQIIISTADTLFGFDSCTLARYEWETNRCYSLATVDTMNGARQDAPPAYAGHPPTARMRKAMECGAQLTLRSEPLQLPGDTIPFGDTSRPSASIMDAPIRDANKIIGTMSVHSYQLNAFREADLETLQALADHCGGAMTRIQSRVELEEEKVLLRTLVDNLPSSIFVKDLEGRYLLSNEAHTRLAGAKAERDLIGKTVFDFFPPESAKKFHEDDQKVLIRGEAVTEREELYEEEGKRTWYSTTKVALRDLRGNCIGLVGIKRDITTRKNAQEALRESEGRFQKLFRSNPAAMSINTLEEGRLIDVNDRYCEFFGYCREELIGRTIPSLGMWGAPEGRKEMLELLRLKGTVRNLESKFRCKSGELRDVLVSIERIHLPGEGEETLASMFMDITERKRAEAQVSRLAAFPELNPNPVLELAADGTLTYANRASLEMARQVGAGDVMAILPANTANLVKTCLSNNEPKLRVETSHGSQTLSWSFYPILGQRVVHCYVGDITEKRQLEGQLRQAQKMEAIGQLAGGVAHDFNNILTVIQGHATLLSTIEKASPQVTESAQEIADAAERAATLTRQLLTFSRRQVIQSRDLDLNELVGNMTKMLRRIIGGDIKLHVELASNPPYVHADPGMMEQVVLNLAVNARDAMPKGGRILLRNSVTKLDDDFIRTNPQATTGLFVCLSIADTGCGISLENRSRIFEPFFTTKDIGKGTGLGLATVYGIVKQHHGWIQVQSQVGEGTRFDVYLPALERTQASQETAVPETPPPRGKETILIVDDEVTVGRLARKVLQHYGYKVLEASNGPEALEVWRAQRDRIDLILLDMVMPGGLSGMDLAAKLLIEKPGTKIIFSSGYSVDIFGTELALKEGFNFIQKPYEAGALAQVVRECLDARDDPSQ